jgi:HTH-type transcriptional regulator/antitoxin HipB
MLDKRFATHYYSRTVTKLECASEADLKEKVGSPAAIGRLVREKRKTDGLTLAQAAALCNVGYRFFSNIENGKPTAQIGKVFQVLTGLGLEIGVGPRGWKNEP